MLIALPFSDKRVMRGKLFFSFDLVLVLLDVLFLFMCEPVHTVFVYVVDLFVMPFCINRFTIFRQKL